MNGSGSDIALSSRTSVRIVGGLWNMAKAIELVEARRGVNDRWRLDTRYPGKMPVETDEGEGEPSRWITLRALRLLDWYSRGGMP